MFVARRAGEVQHPHCCVALEGRTNVAHANDAQCLARQLRTHWETNAAPPECLLLLADLHTAVQLSSLASAQRSISPGCGAMLDWQDTASVPVAQSSAWT